MDFAIGGAAAMCAGLFTNPLEVAKTRMQLQGELQSRGKYAVYYKNVPHALYTIAKADGILALQKGLVPALWVQLFLNGFRLGTYEFCSSNGLLVDKNGELVVYKSMGAACLGAVLGAGTSSPLFLIKTHLQSQSASSVAVGCQHKHNGMYSGLKNIYLQYGIPGLFRGVEAVVVRGAIGGTAQLTSFALTKDWMETRKLFSDSPLLQTFCASMIGGIALCLVMTPFDVISTRLYNQAVDANGKGILYEGYFDCVIKIWQKEYIYGFYKGLGPSYLRLGPHTVLCLVFWDKFKSLHTKYFSGKKLEFS